MNELNNDWVLWGSLIALGFTIVAFIGFAWKVNGGMSNTDVKED